MNIDSFEDEWNVDHAPFGYAESDYMPGSSYVPLPCDGEEYKNYLKEKKNEESRFSCHLKEFVHVKPQGK